jgi:hypothetical protein
LALAATADARTAPVLEQVLAALHVRKNATNGARSPRRRSAASS